MAHTYFTLQRSLQGSILKRALIMRGSRSEILCQSVSVYLSFIKQGYFDGHALLAVSVNIYQSSILHSAICQNEGINIYRSLQVPMLLVKTAIGVLVQYL